MIQLPPIPQHVGQPVQWGQLYGCSQALMIAKTAAQHKGLSLVITHSAQSAGQLEQDIRFFLDEDLPIIHFPEWETLPYDVFSAHPDIVSERLQTLSLLPKTQKALLILPAVSLLQRICPSSHIDEHAFVAKVGEQVDREAFRAQLERAGYYSVPQVMEHGEFSVRGSLIDFFPMGQKQPLRMDWLDDEIDSIKTFNPESQRSDTTLEHVNLLPAHEMPMDEAAIKTFRTRWRERFESDPQAASVYRDVSDGLFSAGLEYYLPLFFEQTSTLFDYLPQHTLILNAQPQQEDITQFWQQLSDRHEQRSHNIERPILSPTELYIKPETLNHALAAYPQIQLYRNERPEGSTKPYNLGTHLPQEVPLSLKSDHPSERLAAYLHAKPNRTVIFVAESPGRKESLLNLLRPLDIYPKPLQHWQAVEQDTQYYIAVSPLSTGLDTDDWLIICENQIYGERAAQTRRRRSSGKVDAQNIISSLSDLSIGSPVVHEEHGVGRYQGLITLTLGDIEQEFLCLHYADSDKLYVPVSDLHLVSRYSGASAEHAPLHKLGSEQWGKQKAKAAKQVRDVAAELLAIHAHREARTGSQIVLNHTDYALFSANFPFEETEDQQDAIHAVLEDLQKPQSMDRVVCGDVGFGKTEVAMRAAFAVSMAQKQVCILVPTTLLAQQHYENFKDRFADWPVRIECLSRFGGKKQQDVVIADLAAGRVDIVIGTHKLLQPSIQFKDLGLVIVDEEQRFGVRHKEQMKKLRAEVDILTLTATPIPRTLNMAMSGIRDLSIIATPPQKRTAVKTFISEWNDDQIREACQRELARGGQVYFVHNKVETIAKMAASIETLVPSARTAIAHGQMSEKELESVMLDFYHQRVNILVCTTIIESGIDVPTANTIIINRADRFGLAQLHQMRGRVGRSHHRAYAYLITPNQGVMSADAVKRLDAIESLEELGAGFMLASHDLEIRGAGELLGAEQSGQIQEIGFGMYTDMLERAVKALKNGDSFDPELPTDTGLSIDLGIPTLLPSDYVPDVHNRLMLYKKIANCETQDDIDGIKVELIDRFGLLPEPAQHLLSVARMKQLCTALGVDKVDAGKSSGRVEFNAKPNIDPTQLILLLQRHPVLYQFDGAQTLRFKKEFDTYDERIAFIFDMLNQLKAPQAA